MSKITDRIKERQRKQQAREFAEKAKEMERQYHEELAKQIVLKHQQIRDGQMLGGAAAMAGSWLFWTSRIPPDTDKKLAA